MKTITENALIKRINRKLEPTNQVLRKSRAGSRAFEDFGQFYIVDWMTRALVDSFVDLPSLAGELGIAGVMGE